MTTDFNRIANLFKNKKFQRFALYFFEKPRSVSEVARLSKVSRPTIYAMGEIINDYFEFSNLPKFSKVRLTGGFRFRLNIKVLAIYFIKNLGLNRKEASLLLKIISEPEVRDIVVKNNNDTEAMINKVLLTMLFISVGTGNSGEDTVPFSQLINLFSREIMWGKFMKMAKELDETEKQTSYKGRKTDFAKLADQTTKLGTEKEIRNYEQVIKRYTKLSNENRKIFSDMFKKLFRSQIPIITYPSTWYRILSHMLPLLKDEQTLQEKEFHEWANS